MQVRVASLVPTSVRQQGCAPRAELERLGGGLRRLKAAIATVSSVA
ncbi:MAG: hypothetical protein ACYDAG_01905 [Chloroflexota bacterium]